jgi:hypothetical protein
MSGYVSSWIPVRKLRNVPSWMCWSLQLPVNIGILRMFVTEMPLALKSSNFNFEKSYIVTIRVKYLEVQTLKFGYFIRTAMICILFLFYEAACVSIFSKPTHRKLNKFATRKIISVALFGSQCCSDKQSIIVMSTNAPLMQHQLRFSLVTIYRRRETVDQYFCSIFALWSYYSR